MNLNKFKKSGLSITNSLLIIFWVLATSCTAYHLQNFSAGNHENNAGLAGFDSRVVSMYTPYHDSIEKKMQKVISITATELEKGKPESRLTNFFADFYMEEGSRICTEKRLDFRPDVGYQNYGGIRISLPKGNITVGKIFELMPFENEMVFVKLNGDQLKTFLDQIAAKGGDSVSGVKFGIRDGKATNVLIAGVPLDTGKTYWLATNDYVAEGGDDLSVLKKRIDYVATGSRIRDLLISYLENKMKSGITLSPVTDGRIYHE